MAARIAKNTLLTIKNICINGHRTNIMPPRWVGGGYQFTEKEEVYLDPSPRWMHNPDRAFEPDPPFEEIMKKRNYVDPEILKSVNIGTTFRPQLTGRATMRAIVKKNRENPDLEKAARHRTLKIDLEEVKKEYRKEQFLLHVKQTAAHYGIWRDLFNGAFFLPVNELSVLYDLDEEYVNPVYHGNRLTPSEAGAAPTVEINRADDDDSLWTLIMTNPDGHLQDNEQEYLHWMVGNIPGGDVSKGEVLCDYLRPFPAKGTGFHRHVFLLFKQKKLLDLSSTERRESTLAARTFKTIDFYRKYEEDLVPQGLAFFQSEWDESVREVYHNVLNMKEPEFEFWQPPPYIAKQKMYPGKEPFNRYFDRYRDKKEVAEEVVKEKLKLISPNKPYEPPFKWPHVAHRVNKGYKPTWLTRKEELMLRRREQWRDLP